MKRQLALPLGPEVLLAARTAKLARAIARQAPVDLVFATSSPYAMLVHGVAAARALRVPLVLDLRDPWSLNFLQSHRAGWVRRSEARIERSLLRTADAVIFTSRSARDAYADLYPWLDARLHTITNAYDRPPAEPHAVDGGAQLRLIHFGNCYGPRTLETPLRAIRLLCDRGANPSSFDLLNLGRIGERDLKLARRLGLEKVLRFEPARSYDVGLELLRACDLQVLVGYGAESLFIPAKLFDYMAAGAPVMAVVPQGEVSDIVEGHGLGRTCAPGDTGACAEILSEALRSRRSMRQAHPADLETYSARATTAQLAGIFDHVSGLEAVPQFDSKRWAELPNHASSSRARAW